MTKLKDIKYTISYLEKIESGIEPINKVYDSSIGVIDKVRVKNCIRFTIKLLNEYAAIVRKKEINQITELNKKWRMQHKRTSSINIVHNSYHNNTKKETSITCGSKVVLYDLNDNIEMRFFISDKPVNVSRHYNKILTHNVYNVVLKEDYNAGSYTNDGYMVISFKSILSNNLLGKSEGDIVQFSSNGTISKYKILKIEN